MQTSSDIFVSPEPITRAQNALAPALQFSTSMYLRRHIYWQLIMAATALGLLGLSVSGFADNYNFYFVEKKKNPDAAQESNQPPNVHIETQSEESPEENKIVEKTPYPDDGYYRNHGSDKGRIYDLRFLKTVEVGFSSMAAVSTLLISIPVNGLTMVIPDPGLITSNGAFRFTIADGPVRTFELNDSGMGFPAHIVTVWGIEYEYLPQNIHLSDYLHLTFGAGLLGLYQGSGFFAATSPYVGSRLTLGLGSRLNLGASLKLTSGLMGDASITYVF